MCVFTSIFAALGTALGSIGASMAGAATAGSIAGAVGGGLISAGTAIGTSAVALGTAASIGLGSAAVGAGAIGLSTAMSNKNSGNSGSLSINADTLKQSPTSLSDTVSKSADKMVETNRKSNPLSSLRIKQTMNNKQETGINIANDSGTGLNLGG